MKQISKSFFIGLGVVVLLLSGCEMGNVKTVLVVEGMVAKGPIANTTVTVTKAIDNTALGQAITDSRGYYEVDTKVFYDGVIKVTTSGGTYIDEITGNSTNATPFILEAIASVGGTDKNIVNITPFTTISAKKIAAVKNYSKEFVSTANNKIGKIFTGNSFDVTKITPNIINDVSDDALTDENSILYGIILAGFSKDSNKSAHNVRDMLDPALPNSYTAAVNLDREELSAVIADKLSDTLLDAVITGDAVSTNIDKVKNALSNAKDEKKPSIYVEGETLSGMWDTDLNKTWLPTNTGGNITSCDINETLLSGLVFSRTNCAITGRPSLVESIGKKYTITARNALGSSPQVLTILIDKKDRPITFPGEVSGQDTIIVKSTGSSPFNTMQVVDPKKIADPTRATGSCVFSQPVGSNNIAAVHSTSGLVTMGISTGDVRITCQIEATSFYKFTFASYIVRSVDGPPNITHSDNANIPAEFNTTLNWTIRNDGGPINIGGCSTSETVGFGLDFNTTTCAITGKPSSMGVQNFQITATNGFEPDSVRQVTISVGRATDSIDYGADLIDIDVNSANILKAVVPGGEGNGSGAITYSSSNSAVATIIDATTGEFNITGLGNAILTATKAQSTNHNLATDTVNLTVINATAPTVDHPNCVPTNGATDINNSHDITIAWSRAVSYVAGKSVRVTDQNMTHSIVFASGAITPSANNIVLDVDPANPLKNGHKYCIDIDSAAFQDAGSMTTTDTIGQSLCFTTIPDIGPCRQDCIDNLCF